MSDETTLLSCPFCGGEADIRRGDNGKWYIDTLRCGNGDTQHHAYVIADTKDEAIAAWNTRAELGSESIDYMLNTIGKLEEENERLRSSCNTLTAEQVHKAVNAHRNITDNRFYCDWQAIADELNAALGGGECEMIPSFTEPRTLNDCQEFCCSACGEYMVVQEFPGFLDDTPNFCPYCGAKVKAVEQ